MTLFTVSSLSDLYLKRFEDKDKFYFSFKTQYFFFFDFECLKQKENILPGYAKGMILVFFSCKSTLFKCKITSTVFCTMF